MKRIFVCLLASCAMAGSALVHGAEVPSSHKEAVDAFPELGRAASPLHRKFMELYARAKAANSPVLLQPDWPLTLARQAAASLPGPAAEKPEAPPSTPPPSSPPSTPSPPAVSHVGPFDTPDPIKLQPLTLYVPSSEPPDSTTTGATPEQVQVEWQKKKAHLVTLPAQIIDPARTTVPDEIPPPGPEPNLWRTLSQLQRARKDGNLDAAKALIVPEARRALSFESKGRSAIAKPTEILLVVQIHGNTVVFLREGGVITPLTVVVRAGEYLVASVQTWEAEDRRLLFDLTDFLEKKPASGLLAK